MMKKMKGVVPMERVVPMESPYDEYQKQRNVSRYQSLLQDYEDLQKETQAMSRKLEATKEKKLLLSAEVRFLRQRYKYLLKNPLPKKPPLPPKQEVLKQKKLKNQAPMIPPKGRNYNRKESTLRPPTASHLIIPKDRISNGVEVVTTLQKNSNVFDLNQNARSCYSKKDASFPSYAPVLDLNHKDRTHNGKEVTTKKNPTPVFDLNQISREEEEFQVNNNESMKTEEAKRSSTQRLVSDEQQHNDIKLSVVCRNVGDGSNRTGKRKITWQDQVALRV